MNNLDDFVELEKIDGGKLTGSIEAFTKQVSQAWEEASQVSFPPDYNKVENIVVSGMGGSALGPDILRNLFKDRLTKPFLINNHYHLPAFVNEESLVVLSSYSGTTEEVLAAGDEAKRKRAKICVITEGGDLAEFAKTGGYPTYLFNPTNNPSGQPRLGLGYTFTGLLSILNKLGLVLLGPEEVTEAVENAESLGKKFLAATPKEDNPAKQMAINLFNSVIMIVASEFLSGNAHVFANQTNENSKNFANYFLVPELNHHMLEGNTHPASVKKDMSFLFLDSSLYTEKILKRISITKEILGKEQVRVYSFQLSGKDQLTQVLEAILFSSWVTFYLGVLYDVDPVKIPWVDYFKEQLEKS